MAKVRIQKVLSEAGVASRRASEQLILDGRVTVDGEPVADLPCFVDPAGADIRVDGRRIRAGRRKGKVYFLLNKPRGVVCTQSDPQNRVRAVDLVPAVGRRVYCVGRLDVESTGLIILTNDGELTQLVAHPRYGVPKTYVAQVDGRVTSEAVAKLKAGVWLDGRRTAGAEVKVLRRGVRRSVLQFRLREGRNREVRRMLARTGHKVRRLKRTAIGCVTDRGLKIGHWRVLTGGEVARLRGGAGGG